MTNLMAKLTAAFALVATTIACQSAPALAQTPDFGDNASEWANDDECDDPRFAGPGMTTTTLLDSDIGHDANDCRTAWEAGLLRLAGTPPDGPMPNFGDDASEWANDNECDDPRFAGPGMTTTTLLDSDIGHDATDCRVAWEAGLLRLAGTAPTGDYPDFGDDASEWANDDECDDPRFAGPGMTETTLLDSDIGHDATDCRAAWDAGQLRWRE